MIMFKIKRIIMLILLITMTQQLCSCSNNNNNNSIDNNNSNLVNEKEIHTLIFDTNGGNEIVSIVQETGTSIKMPLDPIKEGYTFVGWDKKVPDTMPNSDMTFIAQWIEGNMSITVERNGTASITSYKGNVKELILPSIVYNEYKVAQIKENAFANCTELTMITIPSSITTIENNAFNCCKALTIYCESESQSTGWETNWNGGRPVYYGMTNDNKVEKDGIIYVIQNDEAIVTRYVGNDTSVTIPNTIELNEKAYKVTTIGERAFSGYPLLTNIIIPNSVTMIRENALSDCTSLDKITLPFIGFSKDAIGDNSKLSYIFGGTVPSNLKELVILEGCTSINEYAFSNCYSLKSITIPNSVNLIGKYAFAGCYCLTIYCESTSQPNEWDSNWNISNCRVYWNASDQVMIGDILYKYNKSNKTATVIGKNYLPYQVEIPETIIIDGIIYSVTSMADCPLLANIAEVKNVEIGKNVIVSGVIANARNNKKGFYIVDDTGAIYVYDSINASCVGTQIEWGTKVTIKAVRGENKGEYNQNSVQLVYDEASTITAIGKETMPLTGAQDLTVAQFKTWKVDGSEDYSGGFYRVRGYLAKYTSYGKDNANYEVADEDGNYIQFFTTDLTVYETELADYFAEEKIIISGNITKTKDQFDVYLAVYDINLTKNKWRVAPIAFVPVD